MIDTLVEQGAPSPDDESAKEAMAVAIEIMRGPGADRERLAAAKTILEYTRRKPTVKVDQRISAAEDLLAAVLKDAGEP